MGKANETVNRSGTCISFGCSKPRQSGTWYCDDCTRGFRTEQDKRRGTVGRYPAGFNETTLVGAQSDGADCVVKIHSGIVLDPPIRLKQGIVIEGEYAGESWAKVRGEILARAEHEGKSVSEFRGKHCMVVGCTKTPNPGYSLCPEHYQPGLSKQLSKQLVKEKEKGKEKGSVSKPSNQCIVDGCTKKAPNGYQTCNDHASLEPKTSGKTQMSMWSSAGGEVPIGGWSNKTSVPCDSPGQGHNGTTVVWTFPDGRRLYGARGASMTAESMAHLDLVLDCANVAPEVGKFVKVCPARFRRLLKDVKPERIVFDWPDMSAPVQMGIRFWQDLLAMLPAATCACCFGGHGRTGTCLAALLVASGMSGEAAIKTIREKHCRRAIETAGQEAYIKGLAKAREALEHQTSIAATVASAEKEVS